MLVFAWMNIRDPLSLFMSDQQVEQSQSTEPRKDKVSLIRRVQRSLPDAMQTCQAKG